MTREELELGSLSTRVFETRTATGSELFSLLTCPHTTIFTFLSIFSPLEMRRIKIRVTIGSLPVAVLLTDSRDLHILFYVILRRQSRAGDLGMRFAI